MGLQDDAARSFAAALGRLHFATTTAAAMTPWVELTETSQLVISVGTSLTEQGTDTQITVAEQCN